ncbi:MAG TPA: Hsp20 family protein [Rhodoblastus sp.]|nr:Hsp20 family protein [Rhodoblastus sp.]
MRNIDFDPFWRTSIGFDRLLSMMDDSGRFEPEDRFPPYDIVRTGDDNYRVTVALAGFAPDQIGVTQHQNVLSVVGSPSEKSGQTEYLYHGIAGRAFERRFNLADFVEVERASFENGLLHIDLVRRVPESMKPRIIEVGVKKAPAGGENVKTIDHVQAA